jgi:nucleoid-associated protein YgaU
MPEPGWTDGTAQSPASGHEAEALSPSSGTGAEPEPAHDDGDDAPRARSWNWLFRRPRETRLGAAALLSFAVLVTVLIANKWRSKARPKDLAGAETGNAPPIARMMPDTPPAPTPVGGDDRLKAAQATPPATRPDPRPPDPTPRAVASNPPVPVATPVTDPADDGSGRKGEPVTLARNEVGPNLGPEPEPVALAEPPKVGAKPPAGDGSKTAPTPAPPPSSGPDKSKIKPGVPEPLPTPVPPVTGANPVLPAPTPALPMPEPVTPPGAALGAAVPPPTPIELPPPAVAPPVAGAPAPGHGPEPLGAAANATPTSNPKPASTPKEATPAAASGAPAQPGSPAPPAAATPPKPGGPAAAPSPPPAAVPKVSPPPPVAALNPPAPVPGWALPGATIAVPLGAASGIGAAIAHGGDKDKEKDTKKPAEPSVPKTEPPLGPMPAASAPPPVARPVDIPNLDPAPTPDLPVPSPMTSPAMTSQAGPTPLGPSPAAAVKPGDGVPAPAGETATGNWVPLPSAGKVRIPVDDGRRAVEPAPARPEIEPEPTVPARSVPGSEAAIGAGTLLANRSARATRGGNAVTDADAEARDRVESVPHVVQTGENFWSISQLYYGSARFYKALWAANSKTVPVLEKLTVNQTIRIPPPEALDRRLILSPRELAAISAGSTAAPRQAAPRPAAPRAPGEIEVALPTSDPFARRKAEQTESDSDEPIVGPSVRPRRPQYRVHTRETLRSIARDTLGDSRRASEILDLNADAIDDPNRLIPGQILELPDDAKVGTARSTRRDR